MVAPLHRPGRSPMKGGIQGLGMLPTACHPADRPALLKEDIRPRRMVVEDREQQAVAIRTICGATRFEANLLLALVRSSAPSGWRRSGSGLFTDAATGSRPRIAGG